MGIFDFPVSKLMTYEGRNPRPADFDAYWDRALAEMEAVDPQVSLTPATYQHPAVECFVLYRYPWRPGVCQVSAPQAEKGTDSRNPAVPRLHRFLR